MAVGWLVSCGTSSGVDPAPAPRPREAVEAERSPRVLGLPLNRSPSAVRSVAPELRYSTPNDASMSASGQRSFGGRSWRTQLVFFENRLTQVTASATITLEGFERVAARLEEELGPAERLVCASEVGPPLGAYLQTGRGSVSLTWDDGRVRAWLSLHPIASGTLQAYLGADWLPIAARHRDAVELEGSPKQATGRECASLSTSWPTAVGLTFGDSPDEVRAALGTTERIERFQVGVSRSLAGVDGTLHLHFYDGCLAVALFQGPGTLESHRALQSMLLSELGEAERREQCSPTGEAPTQREIEAQRGILATRWETPELRASLRLSRTSDREPPRVQLEVSSRALEGRAPEVDFGGR